MKMNKGIVKWFNKEKGYGFINDEAGKDVFVHHSNILMQGYRSLEAGQEVTYDIGENDKGECAVNVQVVEA